MLFTSEWFCVLAWSETDDESDDDDDEDEAENEVASENAPGAPVAAPPTTSGGPRVPLANNLHLNIAANK